MNARLFQRTREQRLVSPSDTAVARAKLRNPPDAHEVAGTGPSRKGDVHALAVVLFRL